MKKIDLGGISTAPSSAKPTHATVTPDAEFQAYLDQFAAINPQFKTLKNQSETLGKQLGPRIKALFFSTFAGNGGPLESALPKVGEWVWQPKVDDWRAVVHVPTRTVWNQYGKLMSIAGKFPVALTALSAFGRAEWLDVGMMENRHDLMRGCIIVFDMMDEPTWSQERRYGVLRQMFPVLPVNVASLLATTGGQVRDSVYLISQWDNVESTEDALKRQAWLKIQNESIGHKFFEGLVAKRADSPYTFGAKPKQVTPDWVKHQV